LSVNKAVDAGLTGATVVVRAAFYGPAILKRMVTPAKARPGTREEKGVSPLREEDVATDSPWVTIVWDDPVNLMTYVTYVFQKLFGYSEPHATKLMMQVHNEGKAVVSAGSRESMEVDVSKLHAAGLWATLQQDR
jgi:ATP-dependent Clp protease adaptor protein ClpS